MHKIQFRGNFREALKIKFILTTKANGFVILNNKDSIPKIEEQIGESAVSNISPISALTSKTQKHLAAFC